MTLRNKYSQYKKICDLMGINNLNEVKIYLKKISFWDKTKKINLLLTIVLIALICFFGFQKSKPLGEMVPVFIIVVLVLGGVFNFIFKLFLSKYFSSLDTYIFNKFLNKKIKIFYSFEELRDFNYEKMEHITTKVFNSKNPNQTVINLSFIAFEKNADGLVITSNAQSSFTVGTISKKSGGNINTHIINSAEAVLIKNIRNKSDSIKDLNYWFELKEKGAISDDEYQVKKKELL
jgi:hypothetical protein